MPRVRTREIVDISVNKKDLKQLKKGYRVYKGGKYCLVLRGPDRALQRKIERLQNEITVLKAQKKGKKQHD